MKSLLLLLFFPSAIVGWKREWWVVTDLNVFDNCATVCNQYKDGWTCYSERSTWCTCSCTGCSRACSWTDEMKVHTSKCDIADIPAEKANVADKVSGIVEDVAIGAIGLADPFAGLAMATVKEMFDAASDDGDDNLVNKMKDDINKRNHQLIECMGEKIDVQASREQVDDMQAALHAYKTAEETDKSKIDSKALWTANAWEKFGEVISSKFDNKENSPLFYKKLLIPLQNFAALFSLVSVDWLAYLKLKSDKDFDDRLADTLHSMQILIDWTYDARAVIWKAFNAKFDTLPCNNGDQMYAQLKEWSSKFWDAHTDPIQNYYDALAGMSNCRLPQGRCNDGYVDKTMGNAKYWDCGKDCEGGYKLTDGSCNCACIPLPNDCKSGGIQPLAGLDEMDTHAMGLIMGLEGDICEFDAIGSVDDAKKIEVLEAEDGYFFFDPSQLDENHARRGEVMMVRNDRTGSMVNVMIWKDGHARKHPRQLAKRGDWKVGDVLTVVGDNCVDGLRCLPKKDGAGIGDDGEFACQSTGRNDGRARLLSA